MSAGPGSCRGSGVSVRVCCPAACHSGGAPSLAAALAPLFPRFPNYFLRGSAVPGAGLGPPSPLVWR